MLIKDIERIDVMDSKAREYYNAELKGKDGKAIMIIRCEEKVALQWIQNALAQARNDHAEVGRPMTLRVHDGEYNSLLSDALNDNDKKPIELRGIVNLLIMLLLITNIKNVLISL